MVFKDPPRSLKPQKLERAHPKKSKGHQKNLKGVPEADASRQYSTDESVSQRRQTELLNVHERESKMVEKEQE